jgi:DNA replication and repair protein RecF
VTLRRLQVTDLRCLQAAHLELDSRFTLISGPNASGKTSLLEAMYVLGRGRSFRTRRLEHLIRRGAQKFVVFGEVESGERRLPVGVEGSPDGMRARVAGTDVASLSDLAVVFPVQIIDPEVHKLIEEGPSRRRRYLDWGVFHVEPGFLQTWQRYQQVLKQRNAALKVGRAVNAWDRDFVRYGDEITAARVRYVEQLVDEARRLASELLGLDLQLVYRSGWLKELSLGEALVQSARLDQERGSTQVGPHRGELHIQLGGAVARDRISRGQQKLLAAALLLAQLKLFPAHLPQQPSLLLDDPAAELDNDRLSRLIHEVSGQRNQLIVTTLSSDFSAFGTPGLRWRISAGQVQEA